MQSDWLWDFLCKRKIISIPGGYLIGTTRYASGATQLHNESMIHTCARVFVQMALHQFTDDKSRVEVDTSFLR